MNNYLRYSYQNGVVELMKFDQYTRQPISLPSNAQYHRGWCYNCGYEGYYTTDEGIWNVSQEALPQRVAEFKLEKAKHVYWQNVECHFNFGKESLIAIIFGLFSFVGWYLFLNLFASESVDFMDHVCYYYNWWPMQLFVLITFIILPIVITAHIWLYCYIRNNRVVRQKIMKDNGGTIPAKPSDNWEDYLNQIPAIDFPLPPNQE